MTLPNVVTSVIARICAFFVKDLDGILDTFAKLEVALEALIDRSLKDIENTVYAAEALQAKQDALNAEVDRAYRVYHRITELTK